MNLLKLKYRLVSADFVRVCAGLPLPSSFAVNIFDSPSSAQIITSSISYVCECTVVCNRTELEPLETHTKPRRRWSQPEVVCVCLCLFWCARIRRKMCFMHEHLIRLETRCIAGNSMISRTKCHFQSAVYAVSSISRGNCVIGSIYRACDTTLEPLYNYLMIICDSCSME